MQSETMTMNAKELRTVLEDIITDYETERQRSYEEAQKLNQQNNEWWQEAFDHAQAMHRITHQLQTLSNMIYRLGSSDTITITISN